jgi:hypothetical protein
VWIANRGHDDLQDSGCLSPRFVVAEWAVMNARTFCSQQGAEPSQPVDFKALYDNVEQDRGQRQNMRENSLVVLGERGPFDRLHHKQMWKELKTQKCHHEESFSCAMRKSRVPQTTVI